jgi:hypothetical protein
MPDTKQQLQPAAEACKLLPVSSHVPPLLCFAFLCHLSAAGVIDCAKKTIQWEGLPGLYKVCFDWAQRCASGVPSGWAVFGENADKADCAEAFDRLTLTGQ